MADQKLSDLTALAVEPADADEFYINDGGVSKKIAYSVLNAEFLQRDGTVPLTANWDVGAFTVTAAKFIPDGDTSAGDAAAIGYTASEGLILTGQGSSNDITVKNDADASVLHVLTGTTGVVFDGVITATSAALTTPVLGTPTSGALTNCTAYPGDSSLVTTGALDAGSITSNFGTIDNGASTITTTGVITGGTVEATTDTAAGDNAAMGYTATEGLVLTGQGSTYDITIKNDADANVLNVATGTTNVGFPGLIAFGNDALTTDDQFYISNGGADIPLMNWDSGDYDYYNRTTNTYAWIIGSATEMSLSATTLDLQSNNITTTGTITGQITESFVIAASDETTALTTGTAKVTFRMPYAFTLTAVRCSATTAPTGATLTVDINEAGTTVLSTKLTIDATELTSTTAATPAVISDASLADDAQMTIDIDQIGSSVAGAGLKVYLIGYQT